MPILKNHKLRSTYELVVFSRDIERQYDFNQSTFYRSFIPIGKNMLNHNDILKFEDYTHYIESQNINIKQGIIRNLTTVFKESYDFIFGPIEEMLISLSAWEILKSSISNFQIIPTDEFK